MEHFKKQKETLEAALGLVSAGAGLGAGLYMTSEISNSVPDVMLKLSVIAASMAITLGTAKFIDDAFITPYYKSKEFNEKYGMKKYMIPSPRE